MSAAGGILVVPGSLANAGGRGVLYPRELGTLSGTGHSVNGKLSSPARPAGSLFLDQVMEQINACAKALCATRQHR